MKVYIVAVTSDLYMAPQDDKIYKRKSTAQKECDELNKKSESGQFKVLVADNWHEE